MKENRKRHIIVLFIIAALLIGSITLFSSAMAASLTMNDATVTTDNGAIKALTANASGDITWDGAEEAPGETTVKLQVKEDGGSWSTVAESTKDLSGNAGTYSYSFTDADVIANSSWTKGDFKSNTDGDTKETTLDFRLTVDTSGDLDGSGSSTTIESNTDTATVSVTNEANDNNAGGSGGVNAEGKDNDPSDNQQ